ncbi:unnamed protein product [Caretta caretta]
MRNLEKGCQLQINSYTESKKKKLTASFEDFCKALTVLALQSWSKNQSECQIKQVQKYKWRTGQKKSVVWNSKEKTFVRNFSFIQVLQEAYDHNMN